MFEEADLDGDGNINYEEFISVVLIKVSFSLKNNLNRKNSVSEHPRKQEEEARGMQEEGRRMQEEKEETQQRGVIQNIFYKTKSMSLIYS